jgi:hypothetical protein
LISPNAANPAVYEDISPQCIGITDDHSKPIPTAVNAATAQDSGDLCTSSLCDVCVQESLCSVAVIH